MQEKTMVADTLAGINGELTRYAGMIAQSENKTDTEAVPYGL